MDKEAIITALTKLDPANDDHWTTQGLPLVSIVTDLAGLPDGSVKRADINDAAPNFTRTSNALFSPDAPASGEPSVDESLAAAAAIESDTDTLKSKRAELATQQAEMRQKAAVLKQQELKLQAEMSALEEQIEAQIPVETTTDHIRAYINSEIEERKRRAERKNALLRAGVDPSELSDSRTPIDAALGARRTTARPKFPVAQ